MMKTSKKHRIDVERDAAGNDERASRADALMRQTQEVLQQTVEHAKRVREQARERSERLGAGLRLVRSTDY